jgi:uncharacterized protein
MPEEPTPPADFTMHHSEEPPTALVVGFAEFGLAGLTAVDYLTQELDLVETGHLEAESLPTITPFAQGRPRHHTRLYSDGDRLAVLVGELAVPRQAAGPLSEELMTWASDNGVEEITILSGVPIAHGPNQHEPFYVATEDYVASRLEGVDIEPMGNGYLDGVSASLMDRGIDSDLRVGLVTTPVHDQAPDAEAALRLLDAVDRIHDRRVDVGPLESFAADIRQHYAELAERMAQVRDDERPDDRMFM